MFERYNVNDLYIASINVMYSESAEAYDIDFGGILKMGAMGYGYITVVRKDGDKYIDLQNPKRNITTERNLNKISYIIEYMEPLNKYYTQEGKKKLGKRKTLKMAENYYKDYHKSHMNYMDEKMNIFNK